MNRRILYTIWLVGSAGCSLGIMGCSGFSDEDTETDPGPQVIIDNASSRELRVTLDGGEWITCSAFCKGHQREISPGDHTILVFSKRSGEELDRLRVTVGQEQSTYVLNLLGMQVYERGSVRYGSDQNNPMPNFPPRRMDDKWFEADVDDLFEDPPAEVEVLAGMSWSNRWYLRRR